MAREVSLQVLICVSERKRDESGEREERQIEREGRGRREKRDRTRERRERRERESLYHGVKVKKWVV